MILERSQPPADDFPQNYPLEQKNTIPPRRVPVVEFRAFCDPTGFQQLPWCKSTNVVLHTSQILRIPVQPMES